MTKETLTLASIYELAETALLGAGASETNAGHVAKSTRAAERDGIPSHGLNMLIKYCEHVACGKIDGKANPIVEDIGPSVVRVDALDGFAHPAVALGIEALIGKARTNGIASLAVTNSYNCGVLGYHVEQLAEAGLVALGFTNAPASIAPIGGKIPVVGTNPIAFAVPDGNGGCDLLIDQSASVVAKSEIVVHAGNEMPIPEGWALDRDGNSTTDPKTALAGGTMVPAGGYKGVGQALIVEVMAACLTGASLGIHASSFGGNEGGSPRTGQYFIAIDPDLASGGGFHSNLQALAAAVTGQEDARLPGSRRALNRRKSEKDGIAVNQHVLDKLRAFS